MEMLQKEQLDVLWSVVPAFTRTDGVEAAAARLNSYSSYLLFLNWNRVSLFRQRCLSDIAAYSRVCGAVSSPNLCLGANRAFFDSNATLLGGGGGAAKARSPARFARAQGSIARVARWWFIP